MSNEPLIDYDSESDVLYIVIREGKEEEDPRNIDPDPHPLYFLGLHGKITICSGNGYLNPSSLAFFSKFSGDFKKAISSFSFRLYSSAVAISLFNLLNS